MKFKLKDTVKQRPDRINGYLVSIYRYGFLIDILLIGMVFIFENRIDENMLCNTITVYGSWQ
ncbi:hypothetical protein [Aquimarina atlantica]|nr:hypothetical protein [Aquimarina atlantica]